MATIDQTARVDAGASIGQDVTIGPYCVIGPHAVIGDGCTLLSHVVVAGDTRIGPRCVVHPFASLGGPPQDLSYRDEATRLEIGSDCTIREYVSMNRGTTKDRGVTTVGSRGFFMANSHVGHDCVVGDDVIFANSAALGGHAHIGNGVFIGGLSAVHQHTRIGEGAMIAGITGVRSDVIPFGFAVGSLAVLGGLNVVGMKRRKFSREDMHVVRAAYKRLFDEDSGPRAARLDAIEAEFSNSAAAMQIVAFVRAARERALCAPARHH